MSDPSEAMQVAIAAALLADTQLATLVGDRVLDSLDAQGAAYPFVEIGQNQIVPDNNSCGALFEDFETIRVWADGRDGRLVAKRIANRVRDVLAPQSGPSLTPPGYRLTSALQHDAQHGVDVDEADADGSVAHSILTFRFRLGPSA